MKIAIHTDLHFGAGENSGIILKKQESFFSEQFFPYIEKHKIDTIFDLGDFFHNRKTININTLTQVKRFYLSKIEELGLKMYMILGNHDIYAKNSNEINAHESILSENKNIISISKPTEINISSTKFCFIPWINKENSEECYKFIKETKSKYLLGHFEIAGIKLHRNWEFEDGITTDVLTKFKAVWSGHYHLRLHNGNFRYLGTPYQLDWADLYEKKGFYIFDTETEDLEFIENKNKLFCRIAYDESNQKEVHDCFVKVVLEEQLKDFTKFDAYIKNLTEHNHKVVVDEQYIVKARNSNLDNEDIEVEDTFEFLKRAVSKIEDIDRDGLEKIMKDLYIEAKEMEKL